MDDFGDVFRDGIKWGVIFTLLGGIVVFCGLGLAVTVGRTNAFSEIKQDCEGRYHEFEIDGRWYSCQEKK